MEITFSNCKECEEIPMMGHLPSLKSLYLRDLSNVKSINSSFYRIGNEISIVFPALETLSLHNEYGGASEVKVFPHLQSLKIANCNRLVKTPTHFQPCLISLEISGCNQLTTDYLPLSNKLTPLTDLVLERLNGLQSLPHDLLYNNPNLYVLKISQCLKLREIPDGLQTLNSLSKLIIQKCPNLKRIGCSSGGSLTSLRELEISECHGLMDFPYELVESSAPVLERVALKGLSSLMNLPRVIECLAKSAALRKFTIVGVPKFMAESVEVWHFPNLYKLKIDVSMEGSRDTNVATKETVDRILQGCSSNSLRKLSLTGMQIWECLLESIQHLRSLHRIELNKHIWVTPRF